MQLLSKEMFFVFLSTVLPCWYGWYNFLSVCVCVCVCVWCGVVCVMGNFASIYSFLHLSCLHNFFQESEEVLLSPVSDKSYLDIQLVAMFA